MSKITAPGIYDIADEDYHADPCPEPSLSSSIATKLIDKSPRHAWTAHPRLNPEVEDEEKSIYDIGKAAHALLLQGVDNIEVVDADSWRTKDANALRDDAYAAGKTPLLEHQWASVREMAAAARIQLSAIPECDSFLRDGQAERTVVWQEGPIWCRCKPDWLPNEGQIIWDYKTTVTAEPDAWARNNLFQGRDLTAAFYARGVAAVRGWEQIEYRYVVQEKEPPYALSVIGLSPAAIAIAESRVKTAINLWRQCLEADIWPGYPSHICYVEPPVYFESKWNERLERDKHWKSLGQDPLQAMIDWQKPL